MTSAERKTQKKRLKGRVGGREKFPEKGREAKRGRGACERAQGEPSAIASERLSEV